MQLWKSAPTHNLMILQEFKSLWSVKPIPDISQQRTNGVGVLFQLGIPFSTGKAKGTALNQKYATQNIKYANQNTMYANQNTKCAILI